MQTRQSLRCSYNETKFAFRASTLPGVTCSLVLLGVRGEQRDNIVIVPPFPFKFGLCEINSHFPLFPKTPRRTSDFSTYHTYWYCDDTGLYDFLRLTPFWSNYYRYLHFCGFFQRTQHTRGDIRHKTNFRFLVNGGRSQIIAREQRHYWGTS